MIIQKVSMRKFNKNLGKINRNVYTENELVGMTGLEPATPTPPVRCATRLRYIPIFEVGYYISGNRKSNE